MFRVLVIDDDHDTANSLHTLLEWYGFEVEVAYSGSSGLETAQDFEPDAIVCDLAMPGLDGCSVARQLRQDPYRQQVLLIAMTGYATDDDRLTAQAAGFDLHLAKPADPDVLCRILRDHARRLARQESRSMLRIC